LRYTSSPRAVLKALAVTLRGHWCYKKILLLGIAIFMGLPCAGG